MFSLATLSSERDLSHHPVSAHGVGRLDTAQPPYVAVELPVGKHLSNESLTETARGLSGTFRRSKESLTAVGHGR